MDASGSSYDADGTFAATEHSPQLVDQLNARIHLCSHAVTPSMDTSSLDAAQKELIAYIQKRSADLPLDIQ